MSDIKLFQIDADGARQLQAGTVALERSLQHLIERNLDVLLGVSFLASEYSTGKKHGGRIDTLGIDENGSPVIIEYKRHLNENVINQGLYYLDWLLDHRAEFKLLVMEKLGARRADDIDWRSPRLLCIAGGFTKYDEHAVAQINRNIELIRYARYGDELLMLDLVNRTVAIESVETDDDPVVSQCKTPPISELLSQLSPPLDDVWSALRTFLLGLGDLDEVTVKETKLYMAFRRLKNFACVRPTNKHLTIWTKVDPDTVELVEGFSRDVRNIGHYGTGDLEIQLHTLDDVERAKPLLVRAFEDN
ncbi:DUF5655 domain-containing protein [Marichromatium gracile]|uniref:DUF5655 domain-containing protein n=1 Tax=Marichromatium gracile TaxID=1048 RepID=UPI001F3A4A81|nr:DUF5655 domain-containing protein [Marichromatium gracile]MCF1183660.1 DUF5655 domain-containing protein [Marichromatium gracile]